MDRPLCRCARRTAFRACASVFSCFLLRFANYDLWQAIWALLWDGIELLGLLDRQRKIRRVPQNWMPVVDLVIVLACCITPWLVYLAFTFFHACDDGGCSDARPLIHAAVYLTVAIGYV